MCHRGTVEYASSMAQEGKEPLLDAALSEAAAGRCPLYVLYPRQGEWLRWRPGCQITEHLPAVRGVSCERACFISIPRAASAPFPEGLPVAVVHCMAIDGHQALPSHACNQFKASPGNCGTPRRRRWPSVNCHTPAGAELLDEVSLPPAGENGDPEGDPGGRVPLITADLPAAEQQNM